MLKIIVDRHNRQPALIAAEGSSMDILAELSFCTNTLYKSMANQDPKQAEAFKKIVQKLFSDDSSPTWEMNAQNTTKRKITSVEIRLPNMGDV